MTSAVHTTLALLLLIVIGILLKMRIKNAEQLTGIKILVLSIALPAMIFISLLKIQIELSMLALPVLALVVNMVLLAAFWFIVPFFGIPVQSSQGRTLMMLMPSLAPGLSCFPFLMEFWGDKVLAWAALSDVGNKFFVLILLYLLAMHWYYKVQKEVANQGDNRLKRLILSLVKEPVNLVIIAALLMLYFGLSFDSLPAFLKDGVTRMSGLMTPLVLLYIGMAVKIKWSAFRVIGLLLFLRAGLSLLLSALLILIFSVTEPGLMILIIVFPLSATSFWPFAHMSSIRSMEKRQEIDENEATFDLDFGLGVLACSLPFSTSLILLICSSDTTFASPKVLVYVGLVFIAASLLPVCFQKIRLHLAPGNPKETVA